RGHVERPLAPLRATDLKPAPVDPDRARGATNVLQLLHALVAPGELDPRLVLVDRLVRPVPAVRDVVGELLVRMLLLHPLDVLEHDFELSFEDVHRRICHDGISSRSSWTSSAECGGSSSRGVVARGSGFSGSSAAARTGLNRSVIERTP